MGLHDILEPFHNPCRLEKHIIANVYQDLDIEQIPCHGNTCKEIFYV